MRPEHDGRTAGPDEVRVEKHVLKVSVIGAFSFTVLSLVWGTIARSQLIIFDGLYSFISMILASLSIYAAWNIRMGSDAKFPLGRALMEPLVVALKSIAIIVLCAVALSKAVASLFLGGQDINTVSAMGYAFTATAACAGSYFYIAFRRKQARTSVLLKAEGMQWGMDALLSAAILLGFFIAFLMQRAGHERLAVYVDPLMTIAASLFIIKMPIMSFTESLRDMLRVAPEGEVYQRARQALGEIAKNHNYGGFTLRISKAGREFTYKVSLISDDQNDTRSLREMDSVRGELEARLKALYDNPMRLGVTFTHDKKWS